MALTNCKSCSHKVAKNALECPNCGSTYPGGLLRFLIWPVLFALLIAGGIFIASQS